MKVTGLNELSQVIEEVEFERNIIKKAEKEIRKQRIAEMVANGIDKAMAKVMVESMMACGL